MIRVRVGFSSGVLFAQNPTRTWDERARPDTEQPTRRDRSRRARRVARRPRSRPSSCRMRCRRSFRRQRSGVVETARPGHRDHSPSEVITPAAIPGTTSWSMAASIRSWRSDIIHLAIGSLAGVGLRCRSTVGGKRTGRRSGFQEDRAKRACPLSSGRHCLVWVSQKKGLPFPRRQGEQPGPDEARHPRERRGEYIH